MSLRNQNRNRNNTEAKTDNKPTDKAENKPETKPTQEINVDRAQQGSEFTIQTLVSTQPDFCYNVKNWEHTINIDSLDEMFRDMPALQIKEVGFLKKLPSKFYVTLPKGEGHTYHEGFDTIEEAKEAITNAIKKNNKE